MINYIDVPQGTKPSKSGVHTNSFKIVHKTTENQLMVIQSTNKGYIKYILESNNGASVENRDYGKNHELLRLIGAYKLECAYLYCDISNPIIGEVSEFQDGNIIEGYLFEIDNKKVSYEDYCKLKGYLLKEDEEVIYPFKKLNNRKANIVFLATNESSEKVEIYINDVLVKKLNVQEYLSGNNSQVVVIDFDIPLIYKNEEKIRIKIKNKDEIKAFKFYAINLKSLKEYDGEYVDKYKIIGASTNGWIEDRGSSDYAMFDFDTKKWLGSYHGGEKLENDEISWGNSRIESEHNVEYISFSNIDTNKWNIQKTFKIYQNTSLGNGKAKMISIFNFDIDGTVNMDFSYYDSSLNLSIFYTALTCTHKNFDSVYYPINHKFSEPTNQYYSLNLTEGYVSQVNTTDKLQLDIRFTKFDYKNNIRKAVIADNKAYRKFYYGVIHGKKAICINNLTFSKSLDFIVK